MNIRSEHTVNLAKTIKELFVQAKEKHIPLVVDAKTFALLMNDIVTTDLDIRHEALLTTAMLAAKFTTDQVNFIFPFITLHVEDSHRFEAAIQVIVSIYPHLDVEQKKVIDTFLLTRIESISVRIQAQALLGVAGIVSYLLPEQLDIFLKKALGKLVHDDIEIKIAALRVVTEMAPKLTIVQMKIVIHRLTKMLDALAKDAEEVAEAKKTLAAIIAQLSMEKAEEIQIFGWMEKRLQLDNPEVGLTCLIAMAPMLSDPQVASVLSLLQNKLNHQKGGMRPLINTAVSALLPRLNSIQIASLCADVFAGLKSTTLDVVLANMQTLKVLLPVLNPTQLQTTLSLLIKKLSDSTNWHIRQETREVLALLSPKLLDTQRELLLLDVLRLLNISSDAKDWSIRAEALKTLQALIPSLTDKQSKNLFPLLMDKLEHNENYVCEEVLKTLAAMQPVGTAPDIAFIFGALEKMLENAEWHTLNSALMALICFPPKFIPLLTPTHMALLTNKVRKSLVENDMPFTEDRLLTLSAVIHQCSMEERDDFLKVAISMVQLGELKDKQKTILTILSALTPNLNATQSKYVADLLFTQANLNDATLRQRLAEIFINLSAKLTLKDNHLIMERMFNKLNAVKPSTRRETEFFICNLIFSAKLNSKLLTLIEEKSSLLIHCVTLWWKQVNPQKLELANSYELSIFALTKALTSASPSTQKIQANP